MSYAKIVFHRYKWLVVPVIGYKIGREIDMYYDSHMTLFRDKSALYGKPMKEGDPPSWT